VKYTEDDHLYALESVGVEVRTRYICGKRILSVGHVTPDADLEALARLVADMTRSRPDIPMRIVEVGSWVGESALALYSGLSEAGGKIYCVDTWEGTKTDRIGAVAEAVNSIKPDYLYEVFLRNIGELKGTVIFPIRGRSVEVAESLPECQEVDLVFIDAEHTREAVQADIDAWYRHVASHGIICGHDYSDAFPGVVEAVNEFCAAAGIEPEVIPHTSIWVVRKAKWSKTRRRGRRRVELTPAAESVVAETTEPDAGRDSD
jgi:hypothetical protein